MKKQTGIWIDAYTWQTYRDLCAREKLRPSEAIEKFLNLINQGGSIRSFMNWLEKADRTESFEAYARVLLEWYRKGKQWMDITDEDETPIEPMLLEALKLVTTPKLRQEIEQTLKKKSRPQ